LQRLCNLAELVVQHPERVDVHDGL
jgi:hypothetical protein